MMGKLEQIRFDNRTLSSLPVEPEQVPNRPRPVRGHLFSRVKPTPVQKPMLVAAANDVLELLDIDASEAKRPEFAEYLSGNKLLPGSEPAAHCYCGFQFGYFAGQLGDGAAMYLGEVVNSRGERWELQLKGAGLTPYSRQADGRKVLRSSIREFLASEAMHHLGIPTTRAASVVTSDTRVERDPMYSGEPIMERASIVARVAPSFIRFGSFEVCKATDPATGRSGPSAGLQAELLPPLARHVIKSYHPELWAAHGADGDLTNEQMQEMYVEWFREVARRTGRLVALWQTVGFCHGVLNTDNMSILGLTIDYGPYGWLDRYDPDHICNSSDDSGRYDFKGQPGICRWNLERLAEDLGALVPTSRLMRQLDAYDTEFSSTYNRTMQRKLGLVSEPLAEAEAIADAQLVEDLLAVMRDTGADFTNTFRRLALVPMPAPANTTASAAGGDAEPSGNAATNGTSAQPAPTTNGAGAASTGDAAAAGVTGDGSEASISGDPYEAFLAAQLPDLADPATLARATRSKMPLANLQMLMTLAARDPGLLHALGASPGMLTREMERHKESEKWAAMSVEDKKEHDATRWRGWLARYSQRLQQEANAGTSGSGRVAAMNATNPRYVLRNWVAQAAITRAEHGDYSEVNAVLQLLQNPYDDEPAADDASADGPVCVLKRYDGQVPAWAADLCVSCSS